LTLSTGAATQHQGLSRTVSDNVLAADILCVSLCSVIFCEAAAIYGVIVAIILQTKIEYVEPLASGFYPHMAYFSGFSVLGAGLTTGFANLVCGYVPLVPLYWSLVSASVSRSGGRFMSPTCVPAGTSEGGARCTLR
jgi:F0F1-type ATP synthase membrane subunit c/vacuolar-type H+-ATPase subunit K